MNSLEIYDRVAAREITPEQGAQLLMRAREVEDRARRLRWKPNWMPVVMFAILVVIVGGLITSLVGGNTKQQQKAS